MVVAGLGAETMRMPCSVAGARETAISSATVDLNVSHRDIRIENDVVND